MQTKTHFRILDRLQNDHGILPVIGELGKRIEIVGSLVVVAHLFFKLFVGKLLNAIQCQLHLLDDLGMYVIDEDHPVFFIEASAMDCSQLFEKCRFAAASAAQKEQFLHLLVCLALSIQFSVQLICFGV